MWCCLESMNDRTGIYRGETLPRRLWSADPLLWGSLFCAIWSRFFFDGSVLLMLLLFCYQPLATDIGFTRIRHIFSGQEGGGVTGTLVLCVEKGFLLPPPTVTKIVETGENKFLLFKNWGGGWNLVSQFPGFGNWENKIPGFLVILPPPPGCKNLGNAGYSFHIESFTACQKAKKLENMRS